MSEYVLLGALTSSKPVKKGKKPKTSSSKARLEKNLMNQGINFINQK